MLEAYKTDKAFNKNYDNGQARTGMKDCVNRRPRFYNVVSLLKSVSDVEGDVMEVGCFKGFSMFLMCHVGAQLKPGFKGEGFHIIDSFEGLSEPVAEDLTKGTRAKKHKFSSPISVLKKTIAPYPNVNITKGWVPEVFKGYPKRKYRFVHIDVDIYEPTIESLRFFYDQVSQGGALMIDDYGYSTFPGCRRAVDAFCKERNVNVCALSTGNAFIIKR
jgi:hypothetical protein